jgi:ABC-type glycerol-3-phosphate transport system substrate-binding protein
MRGRIVAAAAATVLAAGTLSACASGSGGASSSSGKVTLTFGSYAWQGPTIAANKRIVAQWNKAHPDIQVKYIQMDPNTVHDKLVTEFASNTAPDIIHDEADDLAGFAKQGYIRNLSPDLPADLKNGISQGVWNSVTFNGGVYGIPSLLQSYVVFANASLFKQAGVPLPTLQHPWTWDQFAAAAKKLTTNGRYGVGWGLQQPVSNVISMALSFNGTFLSGSGDNTKLTFGPAEQQVPKRIHDMIWVDHSIAPQSVGLGGTDVLNGFFSNKYAMVVGGNFMAQQMVQQSPKGFQWAMLPLLKGDNQNQMADPQTYSIASQSKHPQQAMQFLDYFLSGQNMAALAQGDWLSPSSKAATAALAADTKGQDGWNIMASAATSLVNSPTSQATNYPQWKSEIATPAFQEYFQNKISLSQLGKKLTSGWTSVSNGSGG